MLKPCGRCGKQFEAKRSTAKYCGSTCRSQASLIRGEGGEVVPLNIVPAATPPDASETGLIAVTRDALTMAKVIDTVPGQSALILAARITAGQDTGSAMSSMVKQLAASVSEALALQKSKSWLDKVQEERDRVLRSVGTA